jgi:hypothetical protein
MTKKHKPFLPSGAFVVSAEPRLAKADLGTSLDPLAKVKA